MGVPVGGLEWLVDPWGISTNIPPPTSRGPTTGLKLSEQGHYTPPMGLHAPFWGTSTVAGNTLTPPDGSTFMAPELPLPGPNLMSVLYQVVLGATINRATIPDIDILDQSVSRPLPVLPFGPASYAAQSLEGKGLESRADFT